MCSEEVKASKLNQFEIAKSSKQWFQSLFRKIIEKLNSFPHTLLVNERVHDTLSLSMGALLCGNAMKNGRGSAFLIFDSEGKSPHEECRKNCTHSVLKP